jgi:hypothetical protein
MNLFSLAMVSNAYGVLIPEKTQFFNDIATELHELLAKGISPETYKEGNPFKESALVY